MFVSRPPKKRGPKASRYLKNVDKIIRILIKVKPTLLKVLVV